MSVNIQNLDRLISHLEGLPEENFNMGVVREERPCGTVACIGGHVQVLTRQSVDIEDFLGFSGPIIGELIQPDGWFDDWLGARRYPLSRAIRTLKHMRSEYLRTGQVVVDWDAPEPVTKPEWTAPRAVEQAKPTLPAEIVRFLRPADHEVSA